jgi:hypothetical protein
MYEDVFENILLFFFVTFYAPLDLFSSRIVITKEG